MSSRSMTVLIVLSIFVAGCREEAKSTAKNSVPVPTEPPKNTPVLKVDAKQWKEEIRADREKSAQKYTGRLIELTGVVGRVDGKQGVLWVGEGNYPIDHVCRFQDGAVLAKVSPKQKITVRGRCDRTMTLQNSEIVTISKDSVQSKTVKEWIAELKKDPKNFLEKEDKRRWQVRGEIAALEQAVGKDAVIIFKTENGFDFRVELDLSHRPEPGQLKVGQEIVVAGELYSFISDESTLYLTGGEIIK